MPTSLLLGVIRPFAVSLLLLFLMGPGANPQTPALNNDAILDMLRYKVPESGILAAIQANAGNTNFEISPAVISALKKANATDAVIHAMVVTLDPSAPTTRPAASSAAAKCSAEPTVKTAAIPAITSLVQQAGSLKISVSVHDTPSGSIRVCVDDEPQQVAATLTKDAAEPPNGGVEVTLSPSPKSGQKITAQLVANDKAPYYSEASSPVVAGSCSAAATAKGGPKAPTLDQTPISDPSNFQLKGTLSASSNSGSQQNAGAQATSQIQPGEVRFCVNDLPQAVTSAQPEGFKTDITDKTSSTPSFTYTQGATAQGPQLKLKPGDLLTVQAVTKDKDGNPSEYGPVSKPIPVGKCSKSGTTGAGSTITLNTISSGNVVGGKLDNGKSGTVRICIDDVEITRTDASSDGSFSVTLENAISQGQTVTAQQVASAKGVAPEVYGIVSDAALLSGSSVFDFGRVRITMSGGAILSQNQNQFSQASGYLNFNTDSTWLMTGPWKVRKGARDWLIPKQLNTSFDARLTALPVTSCNSPSGSGNSTSGACSGLPASDTFITTPKAALIAVHLYVPYYAGPMTWRRYEDDGYNHRYALFFAPLAVAGFQTLVQSAQNVSSSAGTASGQSTVTLNGQTFFHFAAGGLRFGLYKFHDHDGNGASVAPDNPLYFDVTYGKYENFAVPSATVGGDPTHPLRIGMEGRFTVPKIPVFLGFDSNTRVGNSPGDLRFLFGTTFDVGCLLQKLGVSNPGIASCDPKPSAGASAAPNASQPPASAPPASGNKAQTKKQS